MKTEIGSLSLKWTLATKLILANQTTEKSKKGKGVESESDGQTAYKKRNYECRNDENGTFVDTHMDAAMTRHLTCQLYGCIRSQPIREKAWACLHLKTISVVCKPDRTVWKTISAEREPDSDKRKR